MRLDCEGDRVGWKRKWVTTDVHEHDPQRVPRGLFQKWDFIQHHTIALLNRTRTRGQVDSIKYTSRNAMGLRGLQTPPRNVAMATAETSR